MAGNGKNSSKEVHLVLDFGGGVKNAFASSRKGGLSMKEFAESKFWRVCAVAFVAALFCLAFVIFQNNKAEHNSKKALQEEIGKATQSMVGMISHDYSLDKDYKKP
jgi:hypothetical protein